MKHWIRLGFVVGVVTGAMALGFWLRMGRHPVASVDGSGAEAASTSPTGGQDRPQAGLPERTTQPGPRGWPTVVSFDGPVPTEAAAVLAAAGARVVGTLPGFALLAEVPNSSQAAIRALPGVVGLADFAPSRKVSPDLLAEAGTNPRRTATVRIQTFAPEDAPDLARRLESRGAADVAVVSPAAGSSWHSRWGLVTARMAVGDAVAAAGDSFVLWVEEAVPERCSSTTADIRT